MKKVALILCVCITLLTVSGCDHEADSRNTSSPPSVATSVPATSPSSTPDTPSAPTVQDDNTNTSDAPKDGEALGYYIGPEFSQEVNIHSDHNPENEVAVD